MGRFSEPLAARFVELGAGPARASAPWTSGCGPGALTALLVERLGHRRRVGGRPVGTVRRRRPRPLPRRRRPVRRRPSSCPTRTTASTSPLAQLVVHFMADPVAGLREMARVTRPGGLVAACVWDHAGGGGPLASFWQAVHDLDPQTTGESGLAGARAGHLTELCEAAGLDRGRASRRSRSRCRSRRSTTGGSRSRWASDRPAPTSPHWTTTVAERLRSRCVEVLPPAPFEIAASAWTVTATARR